MPKMFNKMGSLLVKNYSTIAYFIVYFIIYSMVTVSMVFSQNNTRLDIIAGQRSLPDVIPVGEFVYIEPNFDSNAGAVPPRTTNIESSVPRNDFNNLYPQSSSDTATKSKPNDAMVPPVNNDTGIDQRYIPSSATDILNPPNDTYAGEKLNDVSTRNLGLEKNISPSNPVLDTAPSLIAEPSTQPNSFSEYPTEQVIDGQVPKDVAYPDPPEYTYIIEKAVPKYPSLSESPNNITTRHPNTRNPLSESPDDITTRHPNTRNPLSESPDDTLSAPPDDLFTSLPEKEVEIDMVIDTSDDDISTQDIETTKEAIEFINTLLREQKYIQLASVDNYQSLLKLTDTALFNKVKQEDKLKIYKNDSSKLYKLLVGPLQHERIGIDLLRWRKKGFSDAYVVYGK